VTALIALAAIFTVLSLWSSWDRRRRLLARLRRDWGRPRAEAADLEGISDFFRSHDTGPVLDDRTWDDLLLDDVFARLDRTESRIGQQILYYRLRRAPAPPSLDAFEALVERFSTDAALRERSQLALAHLHNRGGYYVHRLARGILVRPRWHVVFPIWTTAVATMLLAGLVWHGLLFLAMLGLIVNLAIRILTAPRIGGEAIWFREVGPVIAAGHALLDCSDDRASAITGSMRADLTTLRRLGAVARWVSRGGDSGMPVDLVGAILEYANIQLLMDVNALYFASRELRSRAPQLLRLVEAVGECDAAIAVASFRHDVETWCRPTFTARASPVLLSDLRHPLVDGAVPNSIDLAPPRGVLITGSNMSGKSTFLRTVGVNVVLAQTIHTCLADTYRAPIYQVRACIGRADDLAAGKSYYLVEVESVLSLVSASDRVEPHLFIFDELFRGTNAVERVAAGEAVLRALIDAGKPHVALAATHDGELVELLGDAYSVFHLGDSIGPDGLTFEYHSSPVRQRAATRSRC
jgi:hypothetical protein